MCVMGDVVEAAKRKGIRDKVKIMIGGAPITQAFCDQVGADAFTPDAASAADLAVKLCG
jgi:methanogenic corrinoid protein MtbC1